jgi:hypothetical protein
MRTFNLIQKYTLRRDAVSLGQQFLTFRRITMPSPSKVKRLISDLGLLDP